jgi:tetratricopeptide (TPR) repeat protein
MPQQKHTTLLHAVGAGVLMVACLFASPAPAQDAADLDDGKFISELARLGLHDLIDHMLANPPKDVEERGRLIQGMARKYLGSTADFAQWQAALKRIAEFYERMMSELPDSHPNRVVWAVQYAEGLLVFAMPDRQRADLFVAYGLPTPEQQQAAAMLATEAYRRLQTAGEGWLTIQRMLPRQENFTTEYVNTGKWADVKDLSQLQLPLYTAWAQQYLLLQSDEGPYFQSLPAGTKPAEARAALLKQAMIQMKTAVDNGGRSGDTTRARMLRLRGDLRTMGGAIEQAIADYDLAEGLEGEDAQALFTTALARAKALQKGGRLDDAAKLADQLMKRDATKENPLLMILAADRLALISREKADKATDPAQKKKLIAESYEPYQRVLNSPAVAQWRDALETMLFSAFAASASNLTPDEVAQRPLMVRLAVGTQSVQRGQAARGAGEADEAKRLFARGIAVLQPLVGEEDLSAADHARALYHLGVAQFLSGQAGYAVQSFTDLADKHPDNALGEQGIRIAVQVAADLYNKLKSNPDMVGSVAGLYERAMRIVLGKYPTIDIAPDQTYGLAALLRERGQHAKAVEAYDAVPTNHPFYIEALYEKMVSLSSQWETATGPQRRELGEQIITGVDKFMQASAAVPSGSERGQRLRRYQALATLTKADVLNETLDQPDQALQMLQGIDTKYADLYAGLRTTVERIRVRALQKKGEFAKVEQIIKKLMADDPNLAGPMVLGVLKSLNAEIANAREAGQQDKVAELAPTAVTLSTLLVDWAKTQPQYANNPQTMLAFELMQAEALSAAGKYEESVKLFNKLRASAEGKSNIAVILGTADALYHLKRYGAAVELYNSIIKWERQKGVRTYLTWFSYVRIYSAREATLPAGTKDPKIFNGIQLLERQDNNLGGEPYRTQLRAFRERHRQ